MGKRDTDEFQGLESSFMESETQTKKPNMISKSVNVNFPVIPGVLPGLVEAWTRPQAEFGLLPAIRSLWWGFKPSVSRLCRAGQRHCSTRRPRDGFIVLSPDKA